MCGNVAYWGFAGGVQKVLNALEILAYRAPDCTGIAVLDQDGQLAVRRCVGDSHHLQTHLAAAPLPPLANQPIQVIIGHGRWAMVGTVTEENAHPFVDRGRSRLVVENGSHNAELMAITREQQVTWWRTQGLPTDEPVHRATNTTELLVYAWEQWVAQITQADLALDAAAFLTHLEQQRLVDTEEQALRLALWLLREGNSHACIFYSRHRPDTLYISSHHKPIALARRTHDDGRQELMIASDVNAALALFTAESPLPDASSHPIEVLFLDNDLNQGQSLFARITPKPESPRHPDIQISQYDGTPITASFQAVTLSPSMSSKLDYPTYSQAHLAEIPVMLREIIRSKVKRGRTQLQSVWQDGQLIIPGLNLVQLHERFGLKLTHLHRLWLIGEGSSWHAAAAAAPLFQEMLPHLAIQIGRPVALLLEGEPFHPDHDLAVLVSWSGTTDSVLQLDSWLAEMGVLRLAVTARPQTDLGRRTRFSGGTIAIPTGPELCAAAFKGYTGLLLALNLLVHQLADVPYPGWLRSLPSSLTRDGAWLRRIHQAGTERGRFDKAAFIGHSPVLAEAALKLASLAQIVAMIFPFTAARLRPPLEQNLFAPGDVLFIVNATTPADIQAARPVITALIEAELPALIHTIAGKDPAAWSACPHLTVFTSPPVSPLWQPIVDAIFFFHLTVALAYGRGFTPEQIDRPRHLAKSVTTTNAGRPTGGRQPLPRPPYPSDEKLLALILEAFTPLRPQGYDRVLLVGGGADYETAQRLACQLLPHGFWAAAWYSDSAGHGPLALVGGPAAAYDCLVVILALDPAYEAAAQVDAQVYQTRQARILLITADERGSNEYWLFGNSGG